MRAILVGVAFSLLAGCATQGALEVYSQPPGAFITEKETGRSFGVTPVVIVYDPASLANAKNPRGCFLVKGLEARWVSGAAATTQPSIELCGAATGRFNITLSRDPNAAGLDRDLSFALQMQQTAAAQQAARAAQDAAFWNAYRALQPQRPAVLMPPTMLNCTTIPWGIGTRTTCQ